MPSLKRNCNCGKDKYKNYLIDFVFIFYGNKN